jgi:hypothetical protein
MCDRAVRNMIVLVPGNRGAIDLSDVRFVSDVKHNDKCYFIRLFYKNIQDTEDFIYNFSEHENMTRPQLKELVYEIRAEILKRMNGGTEVTEITTENRKNKNG